MEKRVRTGRPFDLDGNSFRNLVAEVNISFHITMELYNYIDNMKWTAKFAEDGLQKRFY